MTFIDDLEQSIDMVDLVSRYTKLKKAGVNYKSLCPFPGHNEHTPSFVVSPVKQIGYCFGCHKGGGPLKFLMDIENCEFREAVEMLASITGKKVEGFSQKSKEAIEVQKNIYSLYRDAKNYYAQALAESSEVLNYLDARGITQQDREKFAFGYANDGQQLYRYLKERGYSDDLIQKSQIFSDIHRKKDSYIGRIIFPIQNQRGDIVAFAGRVMDASLPKYINSPASDIYDKSSILYGLFEAKNTIIKNDRIIITEGYMDVIALHRAGFFESVAVSGTALTHKHLTLIKRLTKKVFLCFDSDKAGLQATKNSLEILKNQDIEVRIISLPSGKDPDEYLKSGKDFEVLIQKALTPIAFMQKIHNYSLESLDERKKFLEEMLTYIRSYSSPLEQDYYLKELAKISDTKLELIYELFRQIPREKQKKEERKQTTGFHPGDYIALFLQEGVIDRETLISQLLFPEGLGEKLKTLFENISHSSSLSLEEKEKLRALSMELSLEEKDPQEQQNLLEKYISILNKECFKKLELQYKKSLQEGDIEALKNYTLLLEKARQAKLK